MRAFIALISHEGRLTRISREVDWKYELGEITREQRRPLLFENIKGYPGARIFTNGLSSIDLVGLALGMGAGLKRTEIVRELKKRKAAPIPPMLQVARPVSENSLTGDDVDLFRFPVPHWNRCDRSRYIGTWHVNISKDPETGVRNAGVYRMELLGPKQATVSTSAASHLGIHAAKAERRGQPLEMAVAIGASESLVMAASAAYPYGMDEFELAGGLQRESLLLVKCQTVDLEVPADSEIVLEGVIAPGARVQDGPFFDYAGKPTVNPNALLFDVKRIMFRRDPIFRGMAVGAPGAEDHQLLAVLADVGMWDFHGSRAKQKVQDFCLKRRCFRAFQWAGRIGGIIRRDA